MKLPHHIGLLGMIVAIIVGLVVGFWPQPSWVDVATVSRGPLLVAVVEEGKTRVIDRYIISAPVAGYVRRFELEVGDAIKQGQPLVDLDPLRPQVLDVRSRAEAKARVAAAKAKILAEEQKTRVVKADEELALEEYKRIKNLRNQQLVSQDEEDKAAARASMTKAAQRSSEFAVEVARHELEAARTILAYSAAKDTGQGVEHVDIIAPINGSVLKVYHESEGVVDAGQALIEVGNPQALEVEVDVLSADAVQIKKGVRVLFHRWGGENPLEGIVRKVEPVGFTKISALGVEEQRVLVIADIVSDSEKWQRLGDGYRVEAQFILWEDDNVLQIPASALFHYGDNWAVYELKSGRAYLRKIKIGQKNGLVAQVLDGLNIDQIVILYPDDTIKEGRRVKVRSYD